MKRAKNGSLSLFEIVIDDVQHYVLECSFVHATIIDKHPK